MSSAWRSVTGASKGAQAWIGRLIEGRSEAQAVPHGQGG
jgi:hypothetical protein